MQKTLSSLVLGLYLILTGCNTVDQLPELFLDSASIDNTFLTLKAEVLFTGGDKNTTRGFCWSTEPMPITDDNVVLDQNKGMGVFTASISGLIPQQRYYVRAFAENSFGKAYSNEIVIRTGYSNLLNAQLNSSGCLECDNYSIGDTFLFANEIYVVVGDYSLKAMVNSGKDVTKVCTSKVTSLWGLFKNKPSFNEDISSWDVSNVIDMREVFKGATNFNRDITNWDVSGVISMTEMFASATSFSSTFLGAAFLSAAAFASLLSAGFRGSMGLVLTRGPGGGLTRKSCSTSMRLGSVILFHAAMSR